MEAAPGQQTVTYNLNCLSVLACPPSSAEECKRKVPASVEGVDLQQAETYSLNNLTAFVYNFSSDDK